MLMKNTSDEKLTASFEIPEMPWIVLYKLFKNKKSTAVDNSFTILSNLSKQFK